MKCRLQLSKLQAMKHQPELPLHAFLHGRTAALQIQPSLERAESANLTSPAAWDLPWLAQRRAASHEANLCLPIVFVEAAERFAHACLSMLAAKRCTSK
jgi:hypothetical protein